MQFDHMNKNECEQLLENREASKKKLLIQIKNNVSRNFQTGGGLKNLGLLLLTKREIESDIEALKIRIKLT